MYKHEYKTGDRVVIKPWELMKSQYGMVSEQVINVKTTFPGYMEDRLTGTDRVVELGEVIRGELFKGTGHLENYNISTGMILGYAFEYGEEIEVSDDGAEWRPRVFSGYDSLNQEKPVRAVEDCGTTIGWKYALPVQKRIITKFFNERGEDITESISEETKRELIT